VVVLLVVVELLVDGVLFDRAVMKDPVVLAAPLDRSAEEAARENRK
jgi:hypothetical protein